MRAYWTIFSARFRVLLQYRAAALAGFTTQLFWGFIRMMIFTAFYESSTAVHPMTLRETVNYIWLTQAFLLLVPWGNDREVEQLIRTGNVAYELIRPLDLYWFWFSRALALRIAPLILRAIPIFILAFLIFDLQLPPSPGAFLAFVLTTIGGMLVSSAITVLSTITLFWTISGEGFSRIFNYFSVLMSGLMIPLPLFPDWSQRAIQLLPFRCFLDIPFRLYMGHIPVQETISLFLFQMLWVVLLIIPGRLILRSGTKRIVIQGG